MNISKFVPVRHCCIKKEVQTTFFHSFYTQEIEGHIHQSTHRHEFISSRFISEMDEREEIITIIFSILGLISMIIIISLLIWYCFRRHSKSIVRQQRYKRSQNVIRKRRKRRFTTNESSISFSYNPPHLINQKVKNLVKTEHYQKRYSTNDIDR
jgi:hypothetical protein